MSNGPASLAVHMRRWYPTFTRADVCAPVARALIVLAAIQLREYDV